MLVRVEGGNAHVSMGYGHPARVVVPVQGARSRLRFTLPANVVFDGRVNGRLVSGTVRTGAVRGTFRLVRGTSRVLPLFGLYRSSAGEALAVVRARGYPAWLVELDSGRVHGVGPGLTVGALLGDSSGGGSIAVRPTGIAWKGTTYDRVAVRQREVRVGVNAATLTLPPGDGPFPAVVMVHGSGAATREEFQVFTAWCASLGIAVLADDKRGVGQSTGAYPGERASAATLDVLARDAQREVRYLASQPKIDGSRVGLLGDSQAGWIIALAASREPLVRWALALVGPTVTVDETDAWGSIAGKSEAPPNGARPAMIAQTRALGEGGFDPRPLLAKLSIPVLWIFGDDDRNVPTELCVDALQKLRAGHDFTWTVLPMTHALLLLPDGLYTSLPRSPGFAPGLYTTAAGWLRSRGIAR
jgi:dienelactone hydrolase